VFGVQSRRRKALNLRLQFNKRNVSKDEVISALEEILQGAEEEQASGQASRAKDHRPWPAQYIV
jgi:hypothetical protein